MTALIAFLDSSVSIFEYSRIFFLSLVSIFYSWPSLVLLYLFLCPLLSFHFGGFLYWTVLTVEFNTIYSMSDALCITIPCYCVLESKRVRAGETAGNVNSVNRRVGEGS